MSALAVEPASTTRGPTAGTVLLVEDDADVATVASCALERLGGFDVVVVPSGADALDEVTARSFDLVLLDVRMPEMDGPTTFEAMRAGGTEAPIAFLTAAAQPGEVASLGALGPAAVILKPFDPIELSATVAELLSERPAPRSQAKTAAVSSSNPATSKRMS